MLRLFVVEILHCNNGRILAACDRHPRCDRYPCPLAGYRGEERTPYGNFGPLTAGFVPINAGLVGQAEGCDISADLQNAYDWWSTHVRDHEIKYHDEQGAVAYCLQRPATSDDVLLLDPATHRVVCPLNAPPVDDVGGSILMHATYPDRPAFVRFIQKIAEVSGLPAAIPEGQIHTRER